MRLDKGQTKSLITAGIFFVLVFIYLIRYNQYRLYFLEQVQLFRFSFDYFKSYLAVPGGFSNYLGNFTAQFFLIPFAGPLIVTLLGVLLYFLAGKIFKKLGFSGFLWSIVPVLIMAGLHGDNLYRMGLTMGMLVSSASLLAVLIIPVQKIRTLAGFAVFLLIFPLTGAFSFLIPVVLLLQELFTGKGKTKFYFIVGYLLSILLIPLLYRQFVYLLPLSSAWISPIPVFGTFATKILLTLWFGYIPVLLILFFIFSSRVKSQTISFGWNRSNIAAGILIVSLISGLLIKYSADPKTEQILRIDRSLQKSDWEEALKLCQSYPETNIMVTYFTNLSLLNSGNMGDRMFHYRQIGREGLSLPWTGDNIIPFFGCDIYYHIGYINEAYRWAFEAMEMNGACPRLLKRLVLTSIINGNYKVAEKFLKKLQQSLYYQNWAGYYLERIKTPELLQSDKEIMGKRKLAVEKDFFTGTNNSPLGLEQLLENQPQNKTAFEYYMAQLLLDKNISSFVGNLGRLKKLGYNEIPVHYEEVILWYIGYSKENVIPLGYDIRKSTLDRFKNYLYAYSKQKNSVESNNSFEKNFGDTYWYYFHFFNPQRNVQ